MTPIYKYRWTIVFTYPEETVEIQGYRYKWLAQRAAQRHNVYRKCNGQTPPTITYRKERIITHWFI